ALGEVASPSITLAATLTLGSSYYWRVDVVGIAATTPGTVWRFTVAPILVSPNPVSVRAVRYTPLSATPVALTTEGAALGGTVSKSAPWLSLDHASGSTPDTLRLAFDTGAPSTGVHADTLRFTAGGLSFAVPVTLDLVPLVVSQMVTDYQRPYIYALHPGSGQADDALLLFVHTGTNLVTKAIPIGRNPT